MKVKWEWKYQKRIKTIFLVVFVFVSPSQTNLWGSNTGSWLVESSTKLLAGLLGRAAQAATSWNSIKAALCTNEVNRLLNIRKKMAPQFLLVFTLSLLWIHLWCGHVWVICWFCHTGSTWNSPLEFSVMTVSFWAANAGHAHVPLLCRTQHEAAQVWLYCQMLFSLLSLHLLSLLSSFTAQALNKH